MLITIIGGKGNMGTRYRLILDELGIKHLSIELGSNRHYINHCLEFSDAFIIATPTKTHFSWIIKLARLGKPILCEKPLGKSKHIAREAVRLCREGGSPLAMVCQYQELAGRGKGESFYNYFRHGDDGLYWDCIQIIGLANGEVEIKEDSPFWKCKINGKKVSIENMDTAYFKMIKRWVESPFENGDFIIRAHDRAEEMDINHGKLSKCSDRDSSEEHVL